MGERRPFHVALAWGIAAWVSACSGPQDGSQPPLESSSEDRSHRVAGANSAEHVGRASCAECHSEIEQAWSGSDHDLAMAPASEETVLGDFNDATYEHYGVTSTFFRRSGGFHVRTDGPDGELTEYEINYTFGVRPLQQYLIEFPDGRLQALGVCWDTRPADQGGQHWFHVYPDEPIPHDDELHWTGPAQNWNYMCAECHSTNVRKGYDAERDRFETTWSEIDVSCEACHGPGSRHVEWARGKSAPPEDETFGLVAPLTETDDGAWEMMATGTAKRTVVRTSRAQVETCGRCHSRRTLLREDYVHGSPLLDTHRVALLTDGLYHADGQIQDEVYVYGSFLQSRMYAEGVTCTDCHDAHSGRVYSDGNALCAKCHLPSKFDTPDHHFHASGSAGAQCVECHMPETTYMVVDPRRDHSIRIPRPDLTRDMGTPNACNQCHTDQSAPWAADAVAQWYGLTSVERPHWGETIHAARTWQAGGGDQLLRIANDGTVPGIARATAISLLSQYGSPGSPAALEKALRDPDPLVRCAAVEATAGIDPSVRLRLIYRMLNDPIRIVRTETARVLASLPATMLVAEQRTRRSEVLQEYRHLQAQNLDRAEAHLNLGAVHLALGEHVDAQREFEKAIEMSPRFSPAWINLADVFRVQGRDNEGERVLREALESTPDDANLRHALGLVLVRLERREEALVEFELAAQLEPDWPRYRFVLAVALHSTGDADAARRVLRQANNRFPGEPQIAAFLSQLES